ncbi:retrovirus-related pol polyprotein from transposon TNT 1-94 [Tanacetum coccineum]
MSLNANNWSSHVHLEIQKIFKDEIASIVNQVDVRVIHFEKEFLKEAAKFVRDFKSLAKEADESLEKIKVLEKENERLLRAVVSQDIVSIVQNHSVVDTSNLQTELERYRDLLMVHRLGLLQAYDQKSKATHQLVLEVYGNYLDVTFRRNTCFVRNLDGVDLLKGNRFTNLYIINLHEMTSTSLICRMTRVTSTKSWLWHQRLSHLNFNTINTLAKDNLVKGLPEFKYSKDYLCPSCEQGKSKKTPYKPKLVPNSKNRLHLLHMDLCGPMRVESINGKQYVLVIVDDYSHYTWVHFLRSKDDAPEVIIKILKQIQVLLQASVIIVRTDNRT